MGVEGLQTGRAVVIAHVAAGAAGMNSGSTADLVVECS
jgi:hypothetical protein